MKSILLLLTIITCQLTYSQISMGYASYAFEQNLESLKEAVDTTKSENVKKMLLKIIEESSINDTIYFDLAFTNNESIFSMKNVLSSVSENLNLYKIEAEQIGRFYSNSDEIINQKKFKDVNFLIKIDTKIKWRLTAEEKIIGNYLCKKAILEEGHIINNLKSYMPIEVWYTPDISTNFGPMGLNGLPGLIVELKLNKLTTIKLKEFKNSSEIGIQKPINGRHVSLKEYTDFVTQNTRRR